MPRPLKMIKVRPICSCPIISEWNNKINYPNLSDGDPHQWLRTVDASTRQRASLDLITSLSIFKVLRGI